jgi:hypothetical protein
MRGTPDCGGRCLLLVSLILTSLLLGACENCDFLIVERARSPDGRYDAVVYSAICGSLGSAHTAVALVSPGREPKNEPAPFYVLFDNTVGDKSSVGGPAVEVRWTAKDSLHVTYRRTARVKSMEARREDVVLTYEAVNDRQTRP